MSKSTELNQELHALRETQHANIQEMKEAFETGQEISVEKIFSKASKKFSVRHTHMIKLSKRCV